MATFTEQSKIGELTGKALLESRKKKKTEATHFN